MRRSRPSLLSPASEIPRHYHALPYATLVLDGAYEEAGDAGRWRVEAGDVLLHAPFSAHRDWVANGRTRVLDLPLPLDGRDWRSSGRVADGDLIVCVAERDAVEGTALLLEALQPGDEGEADAPDSLAAALTSAATPTIEDWAMRHGCARETVWRHFRSVYGIAPARYRTEARTRRAWRKIVGTDAALAHVAAETGYADQAHMTRAVKALTGRSPGQWRQWRLTGSHSFKT
jgi:AraC-like DNA-binding protein